MAVIGAGSAIFSLAFIRDLCLTPRLAGSSVTLMDIDEARLATAHKLATRYAGELGIQLAIESTLDREDALRGADFVVNAALAGGHSRLRAGWEVARELGYRWGGSLHVMHDEAFWVNFHQLQLIESIVSDVERVCPDAWYLQLANPVLAGMTYLSRRFPGLKGVGLCHGYAAAYRIADALGIEHSKFAFDVAGVNHHLWMTDAYEEGKSIMPALNRALEEDDLAPGHRISLAAVDLYRRLGAFPIGDTCDNGGGAWPWWYHDSAETERALGEPDGETWWTNYFTAVETKVAQMREAAVDSRRVTDIFPPAMSHEATIPLIESIAFDIPRILICNISNRKRLIPELPDDFAVEVPAVVSRRGIEGLSPDRLPAGVLAHILRDRVGPVNLELAAYAGRDRGLLEDLVLADPSCRSLGQARALVSGILALPINREMAEHYESGERAGAPALA